MNKKLWISFFFSGSMASAFGLDYSNFDGFFAGLSAGATQTQMTLRRQVDINYSFLIFNEEFHSKSASQIYRETPLAELDLGYGHVFPNTFLYLGGDIFGNLSYRQVSARPGNTFVERPSDIPIITGNVNQRTETAVRMNTFEYGLDVKPGIELTPFSLLYARIGAAFNKFRMQTNGSFSITDNITQAQVVTPLTAKSEKNVVGLRLGIGMNQLLNTHWALSADYIYTDYGNINTFRIVDVNNLDAPITPGGYTSSVKTSMATQTIMLGVNYFFDPEITNTVPAPIIPAACFFNNFYVGVEGGAIQNMIDRNINYEADYMLSILPQHSINISKSAHHLGNSGIGDIFFGYGHLLESSPVYLSGEVFVDAAGHGISTRNSNVIRIAAPPDFTIDSLLTSTKTDMNPIEFGADLKPGWLFPSKTLVYGRAGVAFNQLKIKSNNTFIFENHFAPGLPSVLTSTLPIRTSKNVVGLRLGLGVEQVITTHWSANFDYVYTNYGNIRTSGATDTTSIGLNLDTGQFFVATTPNGLTSQVSGKITTQAELLGVTYHFS